MSKNGRERPPSTKQFGTYRLSFPPILEEIGAQSGRNVLEVYRTFLTLAACALSCGARETEYLAEAGRWQRGTLVQFANALGALCLDAEQHSYCDLLGPVYMEWGSRWDQSLRGEFYTPSNVAYMTAKMLVGTNPPPADRPIRMLEPSCGAGAMILGYAHALADIGIPLNRTLVTAVDLSYDACQMAFCQCVLHGIPARVIQGDTLKIGLVAGYTPAGVWHTPFWPARDCSPDFTAPLLPSQVDLRLGDAADGEGP